MLGNIMSGQIGNRASITFMTIGGTFLNIVIVLGTWLGHEIWGLTIWHMAVPGFTFGIAQGMCMPYAQTGALRVNPTLAGSASGAVVFSQLFCAGAGEQIMGLIADGTLYPVLLVAGGFGVAAICAALVAAISLRNST